MPPLAAPPAGTDPGLSLDLPGPHATDRLGARLARGLLPGDTLLLEGPLGAGKTSLARAIVRALQELAGAAPEEVPSPSYTLVQHYRAGPVAIWHCDLHRLSGPEECRELGLEEAFAAAIVLIEWPDRLGPMTPPRHLLVTLADHAGGRRAMLRPAGPGWARLLGRLAP
jgi:tRNA threonylcarbamoyladenosine biosynthesis protein TsaE